MCELAKALLELSLTLMEHQNAIADLAMRAADMDMARELIEGETMGKLVSANSRLMDFMFQACASD